MLGFMLKTFSNTVSNNLLKKINKVRYENIEKNYNKRYRIC